MRSRPGRLVARDVAVSLAVLGGGLTACTPSSTPLGSASTPSAISSGAPTPKPTSWRQPPSHTEPIVLAVDLHRGRVDISVRLARRIVAGQVLDWSALHQPAGDLDVRRGVHALDAVERSASVLAVVRASALRPTVQALSVDGVHPLRHPARYALQAPTPQPPATVTTVTVVGDVMLGRAVAAATPDDPGAALGPLQRRLSDADLTVGNLESTLSDNGLPRQGDDSFAADPEVLDAFAEAGFDVLTLANNHTGDYGETALLQTLRRIDATDIAHIGAGRDGRRAWRPVVVERNGVRFGFVAFNAIGETPRAAPGNPGAAEIRMQPRTGPLDHGDLKRMTRLVSRMAHRVDVVLVLPHWGDQYTNRPVPDQRTVGAALVDAGADIVVGGHPHWVQGVQMHTGTLIAHSLGNFVFDMDFSPQTQEGVMLELLYWDDQLMGADFTPYVIGSDYAPRVVSGARAQLILNRMWATSDVPFRR